MKKYEFKIVLASEACLNQHGKQGYDFVTLIDKYDALMRKEIEVDEVQHPDVIEEEPVEIIGSRHIEEANKELIRLALEECKGNRILAAERLGISERTLYKKIREYNL